MTAGASPLERTLVIGCGALAREIGDIVDRNGLNHIDVEYLPSKLHNTPDQIPAAVELRLERALKTYKAVFVAYADCGTGGLLDVVLDRYGVARLDGAHCYQFFSGTDLFAQLADEQPGTFYLTDFLAKHFDRLVWEGLGMAKHPELRDVYFGNYTRVLLLSQTEDPGVVASARAAADRLSLEFEHRHVGYGELEPALVGITSGYQESGHHQERTHHE